MSMTSHKLNRSGLVVTYFIAFLAWGGVSKVPWLLAYFKKNCLAAIIKQFSCWQKLLLSKLL
jgi:hypothetical protein